MERIVIDPIDPVRITSDEPNVGFPDEAALYAKMEHLLRAVGCTQGDDRLSAPHLAINAMYGSSAHPFAINDDVVNQKLKEMSLINLRDSGAIGDTDDKPVGWAQYAKGIFN